MLVQQQQTAAFLYQTQQYLKGMEGYITNLGKEAVASHAAYIISSYLTISSGETHNSSMYAREIYVIVIDSQFVNHSKQRLSELVSKVVK